MNPAEFTGRGGFGEFASFFSTLEANRIFLVTGKQSWHLSGAADKLTPLFAGRQVVRFNEFTTNPQLKDINRGVDLFRSTDPELVLAVGGGSVLDAAKCIALLGRQHADSAEIVAGAVTTTSSATPVVAIPTTAGTGSEVTRFATVYVNRVKYSVQHDSILPIAFVADPVFTLNLPPYLTATTGMDALVQAIESYWSTGSTSRSRKYAAEAIPLAVSSLLKAVAEPDYEARLAMMTASNLAGKAINISKTTACHALSYYLTAHFGVPHGHAVGLFLAPMLLYNHDVEGSDVNDDRGVPHIQDTIRELVGLIGAKDVRDAARWVDSLMTTTGLAAIKSELKVDINHVRNMVRDALNSNRMANNPRLFTAESLTGFLTSIFL
jgi:alcohol dehydrogenase class IV